MFDREGSCPTNFEKNFNLFLTRNWGNKHDEQIPIKINAKKLTIKEICLYFFNKNLDLQKFVNTIIIIIE